MVDSLIRDTHAAMRFSDRLVQLAIGETDAPAIAVVGLIEALCRVCVTMARAKGSDLDEVRAGLLGQVGRIFDLHRS